MIVRTRKRKKYVINTGTRMYKTSTGWQNYCEFGDLRAAMRYFKRNPNRDQIDVRGIKNSYCLYYKQKGKVYLNT